MLSPIIKFKKKMTMFDILPTKAPHVSRAGETISDINSETMDTQKKKMFEFSVPE